ncbi:uncharacterized protein LOC127257644 isoform X2 [Andrographis paniculata]|uniref:uncharacterized protein LOC127257644 isoform X2 n=1 Tax=Andrographis paniculata TaxID=175694 RepID=UPI0021E735F4|nr:uncharacterized protein LOC127257644 isoform X2 [Andrographis paniculata]
MSCPGGGSNIKDYYYRKSGQIPAFGDWENANNLPITQYFECARQAGLLRCSCSSGECSYIMNNTNANANAADLYGGFGYGHGFGFEKPLPPGPVPRRIHAAAAAAPVVPHKKQQVKGINSRKQVKVRDLMVDQPLAQKHRRHPRQTTKSLNVVLPQQKSGMTVKPVDEDLYKVPSDLLENSKRKKVLGFFSRCMVPPCAA